MFPALSVRTKMNGTPRARTLQGGQPMADRLKANLEPARQLVDVVAETLGGTEEPLVRQEQGAGIGALKGPLHGGANEAVMHGMIEIGSADMASEWRQGKISRGDKIMGFGHRVYKNGDSRVPTT
jgi:hypothetical protein